MNRPPKMSDKERQRIQLRGFREAMGRIGVEQDRGQEFFLAIDDAAVDIITHLPESRERSLVLTKLQEASMWACAAMGVTNEVRG